MKPNAAPVASDRRGGASRALIAFLFGLIATPSLAGDRALIDYVGFSQGFDYFAFEEFGIQDGSGFAYANLYVVDLVNDAWVVGTPIRVQAEDEAKTLADVRAEAMALARDHIEGFAIDVPVEIAALIGDGVPDTDARSLAFGAPAYLPGTVSGDYTISLSTFPTDAASPCGQWFDIEPLGYALSLSDGGAERVVHRDTSLPRSRGCPFDYRIHSVVMPFMGTSLEHAVAIISVYPGGFEGPDRRFLAVPLGR